MCVCVCVCVCARVHNKPHLLRWRVRAHLPFLPRLGSTEKATSGCPSRVLPTRTEEEREREGRGEKREEKNEEKNATRAEKKLSGPDGCRYTRWHGDNGRFRCALSFAGCVKCVVFFLLLFFFLFIFFFNFVLAPVVRCREKES